MKYVIVAYLRNVKGYHYPYDIYFCKDDKTYLLCLAAVKRRTLEGIYKHHESYREPWLGGDFE